LNNRGSGTSWKKAFGIGSARGIIVLTLILWKLVLRSEINLNGFWLGYRQISYCGYDKYSDSLSEEFFETWITLNWWEKTLNWVVNYNQGL
jgi:hypothetical protein